MCEQCLDTLLNILHSERDVAESLQIDGSVIIFPILMVLEYLQGRSIITHSGQEKMHTLDMGIGQTGEVIHPTTFQIPHRGLFPAPEHLDVEIGKSPPITTYQIDM